MDIIFIQPTTFLLFFNNFLVISICVFLTILKDVALIVQFWLYK